MDRGWVKIYRKEVDWEYFTDPKTAHLFHYLILAANHKPRTWQGIDIPAGGLVTSRKSLSEATGLTENEIRTALKKLEKSGNLTRSKVQKYTLLIVNNYSLYQEVNQERARSGQGEGKVLTRNKKEQKEQKDRKKEISLSLREKFLDFIKASTGERGRDSSFLSVWSDFFEMRLEMKCPIVSVQDARSLLTRLEKLSSDPDEQIEIIRRSVEKQWKTFYPLPKKKTASKQSRRSR